MKGQDTFSQVEEDLSIQSFYDLDYHENSIHIQLTNLSYASLGDNTYEYELKGGGKNQRENFPALLVPDCTPRGGGGVKATPKKPVSHSGGGGQ